MFEEPITNLTIKGFPIVQLDALLGSFIQLSQKERQSFVNDLVSIRLKFSDSRPLRMVKKPSFQNHKTF